MSPAGSREWEIRRLMAMSPAEVALRAARSVRSRLRKPRRPLHQRDYACLADLSLSRGGSPIEGEAASEILEADRHRLFPEAGSPDLAGRLRERGCPPDVTLAAADAILSGRLPAFGWTEIETGRPIDWSRDPVTGRSWPLRYWTEVDVRAERELGDPRYVWEVNRHHHLVTLARASVLGGGDYGVQAWREMLSWVDSNPPYFGVNWSSALEVAIRLVSWSTVIDLIGTAGASAQEVDLVLTSVALQAGHLSDNLSVYASSKNNHLIGEAVGLLVAGTKFPFLKGSRSWTRVGRDVAIREIAAQVSEDGVSREQAFHYGVFVLELAILACMCLRLLDGRADERLEERISRMGGFIGVAGGASGEPPQVGDQDGGRVLAFSDSGIDRQAIRAAAAGAVLTGTAPPGSARPEDLCAALWLRRPEESKTGEPGHVNRVDDRLRPAWYADGGYFVASHGRHHGVIDCGPLGYLSIAAHGHADCLSTSLSYDGTWYLVDPGTYCYHREPEWRDHFRGTAAHNTIAVDGADQSQMLGPFMWGRRARSTATCAAADERFQCFQGRHDGYARRSGVVHERTLILGELGYWVMVDRLEGEGWHDLRCAFQFAPGFSRSEGSDLAIAGPRFCVDVWRSLPSDISERTVRGSESPPEGWVSSGFGHRAPATALLFEGRCELPAELVFVIAPNGRHRGLIVNCARGAAGRATAVAVRQEDREDRIFIGSGRTPDGRFEGRLGLAAERSGSREFVGIDVAHWSENEVVRSPRTAANLLVVG